jgi:hypothetical protein
VLTAAIIRAIALKPLKRRSTFMRLHGAIPHKTGCRVHTRRREDVKSHLHSRVFRFFDTGLTERGSLVHK